MSGVDDDSAKVRVARFLYEQGRKDLGVGLAWGSLSPWQRDELVDLIAPIVPVLEQLAERLKEIARV